MGGHMLAHKIMRRILRLTMEMDCCRSFERCPKCRYMEISFTRALRVYALTLPWPFSVWGIDIIGRFAKSSSGHEFITVAIDYFTKWVEAVDALVHAVRANGREAANKNIKRILSKMVETSRDWSENIPFALWASEFLFAPLQEPHPTHWCTARFDQLNLLDERRLRARTTVIGIDRDPERKFETRLKRTLFHRGVDSRARMADGFRWKPVLEPTNVDQLKRHPRVPGSWDLLYLLHFIHEGMSFLSLGHGIRCRLRQPLLGQVFEIWLPFRYRHASSSGRRLSMGHISVRMRFTDHEGVACLSLFARCIDDLSSSDFSTCYILDATLGHIPLFRRSARFLLSDIVVVLGRSYVECLDSHVIISMGYISGLLRIPMVLFSGYQDRSVSITRPRYIVFASLTIIPELFIDMSSQRSVVRDS
ncbi:hypothetical protein AAG906_021607 [Vitis piasezkii]